MLGTWGRIWGGADTAGPPVPLPPGTIIWGAGPPTPRTGPCKPVANFPIKLGQRWFNQTWYLISTSWCSHWCWYWNSTSSWATNSWARDSTGHGDSRHTFFRGRGSFNCHRDNIFSSQQDESKNSFFFPISRSYSWFVHFGFDFSEFFAISKDQVHMFIEC